MPSPMAGLPPRLRGEWQRGGRGGIGGWGLGLFGEEIVGEGGDVGYIDSAVGVDVGDCFAVGFCAEDVVDEGSNVGHIDDTVGIQVAHEVDGEIA